MDLYFSFFLKKKNNSNNLRAKENQSEDTSIYRILGRFPVMLWFK